MELKDVYFVAKKKKTLKSVHAFQPQKLMETCTMRKWHGFQNFCTKICIFQPHFQ